MCGVHWKAYNYPTKYLDQNDVIHVNSQRFLTQLNLDKYEYNQSGN